MLNVLPWEMEDALRVYREASAEYATLRNNEQQLEDERHSVKRRVVARIMQENNPETNKPHSASSAEKFVDLDPEYAAYLTAQRGVVLAKNIAAGMCESARIRALALAHMAGQFSEAA